MDEEDAMAGIVDVGHCQATGFWRIVFALGTFLAGKAAAELPGIGAVEVISPREATANLRLAYKQ
jgi:hypothetical protein